MASKKGKDRRPPRRAKKPRTAAAVPCGADRHHHRTMADAHPCMLKRLQEARRLVAALGGVSGHSGGCLKRVTDDEQIHCDCGWDAYVSEARAWSNREKGLAA